MDSTLFPIPLSMADDVFLNMADVPSDAIIAYEKILPAIVHAEAVNRASIAQITVFDIAPIDTGATVISITPPVQAIQPVTQHGMSGNDVFAGPSGQQALFGGGGTDTLSSSTSSDKLTVLKLRDNTFFVSDDLGNQALCRDIAQIQATDKIMVLSALPVYGDADQKLVQLYVAAFLRAPETGGYNYWLQSEAGIGLTGTADIIFSLDIVKNIYSSQMSAADFVTAIYQNVFNRLPDTDGLNYWIGDLATSSRGKLVVDMTDAAIHVPDGTDGKAYFQNRVDWALYAIGNQISTHTELTPASLITLTGQVTADPQTALSQIGASGTNSIIA